MSECTLYDKKIYEAAKEAVEEVDEVRSLEHIGADCETCGRIILYEENNELWGKVLNALENTQPKRHVCNVVDRYYSE